MHQSTIIVRFAGHHLVLTNALKLEQYKFSMGKSPAGMILKMEYEQQINGKNKVKR